MQASLVINLHILSIIIFDLSTTAVPDQVPNSIAYSRILEGNILNITLTWGEPFNNFDPIANYTVTCSGDALCPPDFITDDNTTRYYNVIGLNLITNIFTVVATNSLGSGEPAIFMATSLTGILCYM